MLSLAEGQEGLLIVFSEGSIMKRGIIIYGLIDPYFLFGKNCTF
jgi:hypothetical protein